MIDKEMESPLHHVWRFTDLICNRKERKGTGLSVNFVGGQCPWLYKLRGKKCLASPSPQSLHICFLLLLLSVSALAFALLLSAGQLSLELIEKLSVTHCYLYIAEILISNWTFFALTLRTSDRENWNTFLFFFFFIKYITCTVLLIFHDKNVVEKLLNCTPVLNKN